MKKLFKKWYVTHKCLSVATALQEGIELMHILHLTIVYPLPIGNTLNNYVVQKQVEPNYSIKAGQIEEDWPIIEIIKKVLLIVIIGQIYPDIVAQLKKVPNWNTLSTSQNPFQLI